jgi:hypothetical protein
MIVVGRLGVSSVDISHQRLFTALRLRPRASLVNMPLFQSSDTKDLGPSGSEENGDRIVLKRLGGGSFGVVYLHTGVCGLVYLPTPGLISYRSSPES